MKPRRGDGDAPTIPVLWGTDAVHGHNNVRGATLFPHNIGLGATRNPALLREIGRATARELAVTGLFWTFAPTLAVPQNLRWGRSYEGFSEAPEVVATLGSALVAGLESEGVRATAKHFIGDGGTHEGKDQGDTRVTEAALAKTHGAGYPGALAAGAQTVMASFNSWNGEKLHGHAYLLTEILKRRLGFDGFVVGDWNGHEQIPGCSKTDCAQALLAGVDMFMVPEDWKRLLKTTLAQAKRGTIPSARLDDAVRRILRVKLRDGLWDARPSERRTNHLAALADGAGDGDSADADADGAASADGAAIADAGADGDGADADGAGDADADRDAATTAASLEKWLGHPQHRALARRAARESFVLLKNERATLPLRADARILVMGAAADEVARQAGGWSVTWQGRETEPADAQLTNENFPGATTIYAGLKARAEAAGGAAHLHANAAPAWGDAPPDAVIWVFGETPYAEFEGDLLNLAFDAGDDGAAELKRAQEFRAQGVPVVGVFLSGRPLVINAQLEAVDAMVAAWLPGSEGAAVADVLLRAKGDDDHNFTGKLPYAWPSSTDDARSEAPLFPFGFGLNYKR